MGKRKRMKKETKNLMKKILRESKPEPFVVNGHVVYFNPLKKILKGEQYKTDDGIAITQEMARKYNNFIKAKFQKIKEDYIKGVENANTGNQNTGNKSETEPQSNSEGTSAV